MARFYEFIQATKTHKQSSQYTQQNLDTGHTFGATDDTLKILCNEKGPLFYAF
jgi:hypothetical protein